MVQHPVETIIFDLDGTLRHSKPLPIAWSSRKYAT
jgi:phosphoglycolate phosphatase-like HAD superfamily hydrolase